MLNIIKAYTFCITKFLKGEKPTRYRINKNKWLGFKIYQTSGGKLGEGFTVLLVSIHTHPLCLLKV